MAFVVQALACASASGTDPTESDQGYPPEWDSVGLDGSLDLPDRPDLAPSADPGGESGPTATVPHIFTQLNPNGSRSRQRGAIQVCFDAGGCCSGSILNNNTIMTAAHCLPQPNRNAFHDVTISYDVPIDPNRPFCPACEDTITWDFKNFTGPFCPECRDQRMFFYPHPSQNMARKEDAPVDWDLALGVLCSAGSACDDGSRPPQSLGLSERDFVALLSRNLADNMGLSLFGYGAPEGGRQHTMQLTVDDNYSRSIYWDAPRPLEFVCQGDSGGPSLRTSGYSDTLGSYWLAQATVMARARETGWFTHPDGSRTVCGTDGYATKIRDKLTWINGIVEFWAPKTCKSWTNPASEPFWWCWANR